MLSVINEIYAAIESMAVTYNDKNGNAVTPDIYGLSNIPATVSTAALPLRILLPIGQGQSGSPNVQILRGAGAKTSWHITDLFLLAPAAQDAGLYVHAPILVTYAALYAEALSNKFEFNFAGTNNVTISASITPGMYEYPSGGGAWFYGIKSDITIEEII